MSQQQKRGPGAEKIELEKRLDANAAKERQAKHEANDSNAPRTEKNIDQAIKDSFPASDPPAHSTPTRTGTSG